jgi:hypothetical protein
MKKGPRDPKRLRLLIVGAGRVATQFLTALLFQGFSGEVVLLTRNCSPRPGLNLSRFAAWAATGLMPTVEVIPIGLEDTARVAEWLFDFRPSLIVHAATLYPSDAIAKLPLDSQAELERAGIGAFVPCHLALLIELLAAVAAAGLCTDVINCAYPDAVHAAIGPVTGVRLLGSGNVNNNIPALRCAAAALLDSGPDRIEVRTVMHHAVSHRVHRGRTVDEDSYALQVLLDGEDVSIQVPSQRLFDLMSSTYSRDGGIPSISMAAASTVSVVNAALGNAADLIHMPGPQGLVGGYPVRLNAASLSLEMPFNMPLEQAVSINERAQRMDGIERVESGRCVVLSDSASDSLRAVLGFGERRLEVVDSRALADDLVQRCHALAGGVAPRPIVFSLT